MQNIVEEILEGKAQLKITKDDIPYLEQVQNEFESVPFKNGKPFNNQYLEEYLRLYEFLFLSCKTYEGKYVFCSELYTWGTPKFTVQELLKYNKINIQTDEIENMLMG